MPYPVLEDLAFVTNDVEELKILVSYKRDIIICEQENELAELRGAVNDQIAALHQQRTQLLNDLDEVCICSSDRPLRDPENESLALDSLNEHRKIVMAEVEELEDKMTYIKNTTIAELKVLSVYCMF